MTLIIAAHSDGNAGVENGLHGSGMSLITAAKREGNAGVENCLYRSSMLLITAAESDSNAGIWSGLSSISYVNDNSCMAMQLLRLAYTD